MPKYSFDTHAHFNPDELIALKQFYLGVPAREIRKWFWWGDPWQIVYKHRHLGKEDYKAVKWELLKIVLPKRTAHEEPERINYWKEPRQKCPYCSGWFEDHNWRSAHNGSNMIGFPKGGCQFCFDKKLAAYQENKPMPEARHADNQ
jgi:hypothetical protein